MLDRRFLFVLNKAGLVPNDAGAESLRVTVTNLSLSIPDETGKDWLGPQFMLFFSFRIWFFICIGMDGWFESSFERSKRGFTSGVALVSGLVF